MSDDLETVERTQSGVFIALLGFAVLASAAGLVWSYTLESRLEKSQAALVTRTSKMTNWPRASTRPTPSCA